MLPRLLPMAFSLKIRLNVEYVVSTVNLPTVATSCARVREIRQITKENAIPLIYDEVQAVLGRTGKMWSSEHSDSTPEIMTISKGIGGELLLSAIQYKSERPLESWCPYRNFPRTCPRNGCRYCGT